MLSTRPINPLAQARRHPTNTLAQRRHPASAHRTMHEIAQIVLDHGHPFIDAVYHDGSAESGPYTSTHHCFRWTRWTIDVAPTGSVYLWYNRGQDPLYHRVFLRKLDTHAGHVFTQEEALIAVAIRAKVREACQRLST